MAVSETPTLGHLVSGGVDLVEDVADNRVGLCLSRGEDVPAKSLSSFHLIPIANLRIH